MRGRKFANILTQPSDSMVYAGMDVAPHARAPERDLESLASAEQTVFTYKCKSGPDRFEMPHRNLTLNPKP